MINPKITQPSYFFECSVIEQSNFYSINEVRFYVWPTIEAFKNIESDCTVAVWQPKPGSLKQPGVAPLEEPFELPF